MVSEAEMAVQWEALKQRAQTDGLQLECSPTTHIRVKQGQKVLLETTVFLEVTVFLTGWEAKKP